MNRLGFVLGAACAACAFGALGACANDKDDRPATLPFITETIFMPTCGESECHSAMTQADGLELDTVAATRNTFIQGGWVNPGDPSESGLIAYITGISTPRMPYDAPMPDADVLLIETWITNGASGANCYPGVDVCDPNDGDVHTCDDGDFGDLVQACDPANGCRNGVCGSPANP